MWIKQMVAFFVMAQLALLPLQAASAMLFVATTMDDMPPMESVSVSADAMAAMGCAEEHDMSAGHCHNHSCPSCHCASCLLHPMLFIAPNPYHRVRSVAALPRPISPSLDALYRPPRA